MDKLEKTTPATLPDDPTAASRKRDHIELALQSQVDRTALDQRFFYEPMLAAHPESGSWPPFSFLGKTLRIPLWVSSMTGGTEMARTINFNLARACREFGMGMGLGSCRSLLHNEETLDDFNVRPLIGNDLPLYANLGIAQIEQLIEQDELFRIHALVDKLQADGLIIHVNPMQEWLQPEGDVFRQAPIDIIKRVLDKATFPVIVKEVGQGFGPESLRQLLRLRLEAIDFAANGGTNFAKLELLRSDPAKQELFQQLALVGHSAEEMVHFTNQLVLELGDELRCKQLIISGGIRHFLDGYYLINKVQLPAIYGQASGFLQHARGSYEELQAYISLQVSGLELAKNYLSVR
ncbi:MAG: type 2 isopentenyl-diphosphate Delta-isomerase [Saprospirales bacterium]|nr:type 2 isopentenyl-diphosphate Delta-isomerase [Saprospirales bacterium]